MNTFRFLLQDSVGLLLITIIVTVSGLSGFRVTKQYSDHRDASPVIQSDASSLHIQDLRTLVSLLDCYSRYCRHLPATRDAEMMSTARQRWECLVRQCPGGQVASSWLRGTKAPQPANSIPNRHYQISSSKPMSNRRKRISDADFFIICTDMVCSGLQGVEYYMCSYTKCIKGTPGFPGSLPMLDLKN